MTEIMAVRTGRNVQRSALRCNRNTSGYAAALPISSCKLMEEHGRIAERGMGGLQSVARASCP
jgi:hypothetical protein